MGLWIGVLGCIALLVLVLVVRALRFVPPKAVLPAAEPVTVSEDAVRHMQAMIQCPTVSYADSSLEDAAAFEAFPALLVDMYPRLHALCKQERIGSRGLLYRWPGKSQASPSVFMAHYDVVPVDADAWQEPPFSGVIKGGVLWGRGTLDTKGTLLSVLEAAEQLIGEGFVPANDVYLAFGGNEEISGNGAPGIVEALKARGVTPAFVLDEGGAVVEGAFPGVKQPTAMIGIGEKGSVNATFQVKSAGGHASAPPPHTPVGLLARAVTRVEGKPFPFRLTKPAREMFDTLGRHSTFVYRLIFANLWLFSPVLNLLCKKTGGEMNALVRTTCAFTQMKGSDAANVMPPSAMVGANLRLLSGDTPDSVQAHLQGLAGDPAIQVTVHGGSLPSGLSRTDGEAWDRLTGAILKTWPEAIPSPYLMVAASDARHYSTISEHVYRFCPMVLSAEERRLIHSNDERIPVDKLLKTIAFYVRIMKAS